MLAIYVLLIVIVLFSGTKGHEQDNLDKVLQETMRRKCLKNADNNTLQKLNKEMDIFGGCLHEAIALPKTEANIFKLICTELPPCVQKLMAALEPCLDEEEQYLPDLYMGAFKKQCENDGATFKGKLQGIENITCGSPFVIFWAYGIIPVCFPKLTIMQHTSDLDFVLSPSDACTDVATVQDCIHDLLSEGCSEDVFEYMSVFLEPALWWCENRLTTNEIV